MSNRLAHYWRAHPGERLTDSELAALGVAPRQRQVQLRLLRALDRSTMSSAQSLEVALLTQNAAWGEPLSPAIELAGRGYRRAPCGPMLGIPGPWRWLNQLLILFPQAKEDWGVASYIALLELGIDTVVATAPIAAPPFAVIAGDQPRIAAKGLILAGVEPDTPRPYGAGRYGESLYGSWPDEGLIFYCRVDGIGYQWAQEPTSCAAWSPLLQVSGGCA